MVHKKKTLKHCKKMIQVTATITVKETHTFTLNKGETIKEFKNRHADICIHNGTGVDSSINKEDIGGSTTIEVSEVTQTIDNDDNNIYVECPHCENCEEHPIDEQRHHIQTFDVVKWLEEENNIEVSLMKCHVCKKEFKMLWEYDKN